MSAAPMQIVNRQPPHNMDAEQEFLGALLINNSVLHRVNSFLKADHFFHDAHKRIYSAITTLIDRGERADPITLRAYFEGDLLFDKVVGGVAYLARLAAAATTVTNAPDYARAIYDTALRRAAIQVHEQALARLANPGADEPAEAMIEQASADLRAIPDAGATKGSTEHIAPIAREAIQRIETIMRGDGAPTIKTGFAALDRRLRGGLQLKELIILAGRPSMGKSGLAIGIGDNVASAGMPVQMFTLEMTKQQCVDRIISARTGIPYSDFDTAYDISPEKFAIIDNERRKLDDLPMYFNERSGISVAGMRSEALRLNATLAAQGKPPLVLIIVDHIQIAGAPDKDRWSRGNRNDDLGAITGGLKSMAKDLNAAVIALSQLSRAVEARDDKRPQLSDLRESGNIEQDADAVIMAFRPDYYVAREEPDDKSPEWAAWRARLAACEGDFEAILRKLRRGPIGTAFMRHNLACNQFMDRASTGGQDHLPHWSDR
jgi:replicative DNA helicase